MFGHSRGPRGRPRHQSLLLGSGDAASTCDPWAAYLDGGGTHLSAGAGAAPALGAVGPVGQQLLHGGPHSQDAVAGSTGSEGSSSVVFDIMRGLALGGATRHVVAAATAAAIRTLDSPLRCGGEGDLPLESIKPIVSDESQDLVAGIILAASQCHEVLDRCCGQHHHSLSVAIRAATATQSFSKVLLGRLGRVARAADAVRHTTPSALEALVADLREEATTLQRCAVAGQAASAVADPIYSRASARPSAACPGSKAGSTAPSGSGEVSAAASLCTAVAPPLATRVMLLIGDVNEAVDFSQKMGFGAPPPLSAPLNYNYGFVPETRLEGPGGPDKSSCEAEGGHDCVSPRASSGCSAAAGEVCTSIEEMNSKVAAAALAAKGSQDLWTCLRGHGLVEKSVMPDESWGCDVCMDDLSAGTMVQACGQCNFGLCVACFRRFSMAGEDDDDASDASTDHG